MVSSVAFAASAYTCPWKDFSVPCAAADKEACMDQTRYFMYCQTLIWAVFWAVTAVSRTSQVTR